MSSTSFSNRTAQAVAVESSAGTLPGSPTWYSLGPNAIEGIGAVLERKSRNPISPTNQRQFGSVIDVKANPKFNGDLTWSALDVFLEGILRCRFSTSGPAVFAPSAATSTAITVASGGALVQNTLVYVRGCRIAANNGLKVVDSGSTGTSIVITGGMTAETFTATDHVTVEVCGFRFASGDLQISGTGTTLITTTKDLTQLGLVSGQMCWLGGGTSAASALSLTNGRGPFRITTTPTANLITTDKRYGTWSNDSGTGRTVDLYFGRQVRAVPLTHTDYLERYYQLETTYHRLGAADAVAYGYMKGNAVASATFGFPVKDFGSLSIDFTGTDETVPSTSRATNAASPLREVKTAAVSTVTDVYRGRILKVGTDGVVGNGLTGYISGLNLTVNNNVGLNPAHNVLGSFETSFGQIAIEAKVNAYFTEIDVPSHARSNLPVTADWWFRNNDGAVAFDIPYAEFGVEGVNFPLNETIKVDLMAGAVEDPIWGTSLIVSLLPYCPAT